MFHQIHVPLETYHYFYFLFLGNYVPEGIPSQSFIKAPHFFWFLHFFPFFLTFSLFFHVFSLLPSCKHKLLNFRMPFVVWKLGLHSHFCSLQSELKYNQIQCFILASNSIVLSSFHFGNSHDLRMYNGCASLLKIMWILLDIGKTQINRRDEPWRQGRNSCSCIYYMYLYKSCFSSQFCWEAWWMGEMRWLTEITLSLH